MVLTICKDCGTTFEGNGRRKLCNDCRDKRQRERARNRTTKAIKEGRVKVYKCKHCGSKVHNSSCVCSTCNVKRELWGKIITMVQRAKEEAEK